MVSIFGEIRGTLLAVIMEQTLVTAIGAVSPGGSLQLSLQVGTHTRQSHLYTHTLQSHLPLCKPEKLSHTNTIEK